MVDGVGTTADEVLAVLDALAAAGCWTSLDGGWGVDALVGRQTRPHRDLDLDIDATQEAAAVSALRDLGYAIETDWRPNRVELAAPGRGWVDLHPLPSTPTPTPTPMAPSSGWPGSGTSTRQRRSSP